MMLVFATDIPGAWLLTHYPEWPLAVRVLIALIPVVASLLYVRAIVHWVRGMDELHQQLTKSAYLFAGTAFLALSMTWDLLRRTGLFEAVLRNTGLHLEGMPFSNCTFVISLTYVLFGIGYAHIVSRRYR